MPYTKFAVWTMEVHVPSESVEDLQVITDLCKGGVPTATQHDDVYDNLCLFVQFTYQEAAMDASLKVAMYFVSRPYDGFVTIYEVDA